MSAASAAATPRAGVRNLGESVLARLRTLAKAKGADVQSLLNRYVLERFLYRLSVSRHADRFCLKGGLSFALWNDGDLFRPTTDIDLHGYDEDGDVAKMEAIVREVCAIEVADDGVVFDLSAVKVAKDREGFVPGGKLQFFGRVHTSRVPVRIDVGFGNAVTPDAEMREYPGLLDLPRPTVLAYPMETTVAEKLHAMARHGLYNTRLKDYYDLWKVALLGAVDRSLLGRAIAATFARHGTAVPDELVGLGPEFAAKHAKAWDVYRRNERLAGDPPDLASTVAAVADLALPAIDEARTLSTPAP